MSKETGWSVRRILATMLLVAMLGAWEGIIQHKITRLEIRLIELQEEQIAHYQQLAQTLDAATAHVREFLDAAKEERHGKQ